MKLTRIHLAQLRRFRDGLTIDGLAPGLNLYTGPNEAGKSSIVRGLRAAFFERHRSTSVEDLRPWGESTAAPTVELDFEHGGLQYRLRKSFLQKKRCELQIVAADGRVEALDGDSAEAHLAELLGFRHALKGASKAEHWGIPGLLWIAQGSGQELQEPLQHAHDPLRRVLEAALGSVASTQGDDVIRAVQAARETLLTSTGRPRGAYAEALTERDARQAALEALDARITAYREQVDRLGRLSTANARDEAEAPWAALRAKVAEARRELAALDDERQQLQREREQLRQTGDTLALLDRALEQAAHREREVERRAEVLATARERSEAAVAAEQQAARRHAEAEQRRAEAAAQAALAQRVHQRAQARLLDAELAARQAQLRQALAEADTEAAALQRLRAQRSATAIEAPALARWRALDATLQQQRAAQAAAATRLRFRLDRDGWATLDGTAVGRDDERLLTTAATLQLPGLGAIEITPGGTDLAALARDIATAEAEIGTLQSRLGLATLQAAEQRAIAQQEAAQALKLAEARLAALAPQGLEALRGAIAELDGQREELARRVEATREDSVAGHDVEPPAIDRPRLAELDTARAEAERAHERCRSELAALAAHWAETRQALATAQAEASAAAREHAALAAELADPARRANLETAAAQRLELQRHREALDAALAPREAALAAARPALRQQDAERWERSAEEAERSHRERLAQLTLLRGKLEEAGAQGLEEQRADEAMRTGAAQRRADELGRRAAALDLLLQLLSERRQVLTQRLHAPLQRHLQHGLDLLWPGAQIVLGEDLAPERLTRPGARGPDSAAFDELSFGSREQLGLVARLAYADLLREAGRPTLLILDDALVHSDEDRLGRMKRVLYDAAHRHQVLLFTCHPEAWRDLGVPARSLDSLGPR